MQSHCVQIAMFHQFRVPEYRQIIQDRPVLGETHVVRQSRAGQLDRHVGYQLPVGIDHAVMHVGRVLAVVEEHQLAGRFVDLGVRRYAVERNPGCDALVLERLGVQDVTLAALVEGGDGLAVVYHDIGGCGVLQAAMRAEARPLGHARRVGKAAPQRFAGDLFGFESAGPDEPVAVGRLAAAERDLVDHPVAVERMVPSQRLVRRILGVAQVDTIDVGGDRTFQHLQFEGVHLLVLRRPRAAQVRVVGRLQARLDRWQFIDAHQCLALSCNRTAGLSPSRLGSDHTVLRY